ncbi:hypothetical protein [Microvirga sp. CF3016]|uniref:hypothetical protein n=1 Tax=Microvirga sp. CF3016 TaxID=3110181 RepID=UPI002E75B9FD|nr:hypothetical protein [Microvirga sp. CF3016]MEE1611363.1 hypothetical protein [Microvirga sp. CF3016]
MTGRQWYRNSSTGAACDTARAGSEDLADAARAVGSHGDRAGVERPCRLEDGILRRVSGAWGSFTPGFRHEQHGTGLLSGDAVNAQRQRADLAVHVEHALAAQDDVVVVDGRMPDRRTRGPARRPAFGERDQTPLRRP